MEMITDRIRCGLVACLNSFVIVSKLDSRKNIDLHPG